MGIIKYSWVSQDYSENFYPAELQKVHGLSKFVSDFPSPRTSGNKWAGSEVYFARVWCRELCLTWVLSSDAGSCGRQMPCYVTTQPSASFIMHGARVCSGTRHLCIVLLPPQHGFFCLLRYAQSLGGTRTLFVYVAAKNLGTLTLIEILVVCTLWQNVAH